MIRLRLADPVLVNRLSEAPPAFVVAGFLLLGLLLGLLGYGLRVPR